MNPVTSTAMILRQSINYNHWSLIILAIYTNVSDRFPTGSVTGEPALPRPLMHELRFVSRSMVPCAAAGTPEVGRGARGREGWCRIITAVLVARRSYAARNSRIRLLMPEGAGLSRSSRCLDRLGLRFGGQWSGTRFTCSWVMPRRPSGHLNWRIAAQRVRAAAVTRMYQRGRLAPLAGIRVNGGVVKVASGSEPVTGQRRQKAGGSGLEVAAEPADPVMRGKFGSGEDK